MRLTGQTQATSTHLEKETENDEHRSHQFIGADEIHEDVFAFDFIQSCGFVQHLD